MVPPGIPEFLTRDRLVPLGPCPLEGRAWSGWGDVAGVQVSTDGGSSWEDAVLAAPESRWGWVAWTYRWEPKSPGEYELMCRARDTAGNEQPADPAWNVGGYANNAVQRVRVTVTDSAANELEQSA
jgi:hypothetical protein